MKRFLCATVIVLLVLLGILVDRGVSLEDDYERAVANAKAYESSCSSLRGENYVLQLTAAQLQWSKDSVVQAMDSVRKAMGIKAKDLKAAGQVKSVVGKTDTVVFRDTIFRDKAFRADTVISDGWYTLVLGLRYPDSIVVRPKFRSEKYIMVRTRKETVDPPKKCWLLRLFQKKHRVAVVDITEKSPYAEEQECRYVEIVK